MEGLPKDPAMLMSVVNMKLRDEYGSLEDLCGSYGIDIETLKETLKAAGFDWMPESRQFR